MKKIYMKPSTEVQLIAVEQMMAISMDKHSETVTEQDELLVKDSFFDE